MSIFSKVFDADRGQTGGQYYTIGRVKKVVLGPLLADGKPDEDYVGPSDIGKIRYDMIYSTLSTSKSTGIMDPAYPIHGLVKQYPLENEIVMIIPGPSKRLNDRFTRTSFFYFPAYSIWNNANHGAFPNMAEYATYLANTANQPGYQGTATPGPKLPLGSTFQEKHIRNIQAFEGDSIIQARFGQSIRFGSTVPVLKSRNTWSNSGPNGDPITIILNSQKDRSGLDKFDNFVEDIDKDGSSIWMTSTQEVIIEDLVNFPLKSFGVLAFSPIQSIANQTIEISRPPISNEFLDSSTQDKNSIG